MGMNNSEDEERKNEDQKMSGEMRRITHYEEKENYDERKISLDD